MIYTGGHRRTVASLAHTVASLARAMASLARTVPKYIHSPFGVQRNLHTRRVAPSLEKTRTRLHPGRFGMYERFLNIYLQNKTP